MKFKHSKDRRDWQNLPAPCDKTANARLKDLVRWIDDFCKLVGWGEITITSYYRPDDKRSYHSILQAADIRSKDKPELFKTIMVVLRWLLRQSDADLHIWPHKDLWGEPQEHVHIAIKDGKI